MIVRALNSSIPEIESTLSHSTAFGVGCFHFGIRVIEPRSFSPDEYIEDLRNCLEAIDTVSEIEFYYTPISSPESIEMSEQPDSMEEGACFPHLDFFRCSFSVYLPYRLQAELTDMDEEFVDSGVEHFKVHTRYTFYGPVTFVECQDAPLHCSPSSAVVAVRKYLERHVNNTDRPVRFEMIGPSPFHADFHLIEDASVEGQESIFQAEYLHKPGYDRITIRAASSGKSSDFDHLKLQLFEALEDELGFFYELMRERSAQISAWAEIENNLQELLYAKPSQGMLARHWAPVRRRKKLKALFHDLLSFRANAVFAESSRDEKYRSLYDTGKYTVILKKYLDEHIENLYTYPTSDVLEMVKFEEERTTKTFEWAAVLLAAILGGLVGAVITILAS